MGGEVIWDCFTFWQELDLLEIRLHELDPYVDRFVLVEADWTFQGDHKNLNFALNRKRFQDFESKLRVVTLEGVKDGTPWEREAYQRNAIAQGLAEAAEDDIALVSDVDEIPEGEAIEDAVITLGGVDQVSFEQLLCFYRVDNVCHTSRWHGTQAVRVRDLRDRGAQDVRDQRNGSYTLEDAGWHYCNLGDADFMRQKAEAFSHVEVRGRVQDRERLEALIAEGKDISGRTDILFHHQPDIEVPIYLRRNRKRFSHLWTSPS